MQAWLASMPVDKIEKQVRTIAERRRLFASKVSGKRDAVDALLS